MKTPGEYPLSDREPGGQYQDIFADCPVEVIRIADALEETRRSRSDEDPDDMP
ncbi:hypothetical protein FHS23_000796 [Prauserella isguenensis]|uniref:Uncharacterized protein n=1 Tax=Prauserella isguenensis TaxID=1470180 RepID=A0A839RVQ0_9PSEU|nr:hypothetical protein [Prauserella isguenensis]MBB3049801.1 hypothetical protein [Prauserella isguenensis]